MYQILVVQNAEPGSWKMYSSFPTKLHANSMHTTMSFAKQPVDPVIPITWLQAPLTMHRTKLLGARLPDCTDLQIFALWCVVILRLQILEKKNDP